MRISDCSSDVCSSDLIIVRRVLLQHQPHSANIFARVSPISLGVEVPEPKLVLPFKFDRRSRPRDLALNKSLAAQWAFVIEKNAVGGVNAISLAVVHNDPIGIELRCSIWRPRIKGRGFSLRYFLNKTVQL